MQSQEIKQLNFKAEDDEDQKTQAIMDEIERKKIQKIMREIEVTDQQDGPCFDDIEDDISGGQREISQKPFQYIKRRVNKMESDTY